MSHNTQGECVVLTTSGDMEAGTRTKLRECEVSAYGLLEGE